VLIKYDPRQRHGLLSEAINDDEYTAVGYDEWISTLVNGMRLLASICSANFTLLFKRKTIDRF